MSKKKAPAKKKAPPTSKPVAAKPAQAPSKSPAKPAPAPSKPVAARPAKSRSVKKVVKPVPATHDAPPATARSFDEAKAAAIDRLIESIEQAEARLLLVKRATTFEELQG